ncbi:biotin transporter BioY [Thermoactinomyces sp. CICC 24226]|uniref:biotin transporter BioY n=1 Tax=Thermoactinomyces sp. CICC 24226 TaxID=2767431 RepID=UPI0018DC1CD0|nr:biotin transporter BioY [Thermoactinomyces sp. CICC 24226]MBI0391282.1 biotin transporter BioY [Thermoactinomyces sp. CICC 24226]
MHRSALKVRDMTWMAMFVAMLAVSGAFAVHIGPAPITLQTLVVMLAGSVLGARRGMISMIVFIALVIAGAPVLSGGKSGIAALAGPTGGYIISWVFAAGLTGWMVERWIRKGTLNAWKLGLAHVVCGVILIHLIGFPWLVTVLDLPLNQTTWISSLLVFLPGDLMKAILAVPVVMAVRKALPQLSSVQQQKRA